MGAYAALLSLNQTLNQTLIHDPHPLLFEKDHLSSLQGNVTALLTFLKQHSKSGEAIHHLDSRIIDVAYLAEDIVESRDITSVQDVLQEISFLLEEVRKIKLNDGAETVLSLDDLSDSAISSNDTGSSVNIKAFEDDFVAMKDHIYRWSSDFDVTPIVGMGGIGKSTLARRLYEHAARSKHFDRLVWIVVSQNYSLRKILLGLLQSMQKQSTAESSIYKNKSLKECSDEELKLLVYQELFGRRYLFVVDDVWTTKAWDDIQLIFPKDKTGSRVLVTTRSSDVASYVGPSSSPPHDVSLLNDNQSWIMLEELIFEKGHYCPSKLKQIGMEVAKSCRGLPLTVAVVAGLLKKDITEEYWKRFSGKISSAEPTIALQCSKVLSLSYDCLPIYLKPCFLYVTAFPDDYKIKLDLLIRLLMAEGLVEQSGSKLVEEVVEEYIDDLARRNLVLVCSRRYDGRIKTIAVHDVLRDIGNLKAQKERFYYFDSMESSMAYKQRRLSIINRFDLDNFLRTQDLMTRSILVFSNNDFFFQFQNVRFLKVLDALNQSIILDPEKVVYLRYLAAGKVDSVDQLSSLSSYLWNLQSLFIRRSKLQRTMSVFHLRLNVWKMPLLRHLITKSPCCLEQPSDSDFVKEESNLQTLSMVANLELTPLTIEMLANIRKLGLYYYWENGMDRKDYHLSNLILLGKIEELEIVFDNVEWGAILELKFPSSLKRLTFGCWNPCGDINVAVVDLLPDVEMLKLKGKIYTNGEWNPVEGQFEKLRHLELDEVNLNYWGVESIHFPSLEILVLKNMGKELEEIPSDIGEIDSLQLIKLHKCEPSLVASAKQIQAIQEGMGNTCLQVIVAEEQISREDDFDLDLEDIMVMEAIWLSIQEQEPETYIPAESVIVESPDSQLVMTGDARQWVDHRSAVAESGATSSEGSHEAIRPSGIGQQDEIHRSFRPAATPLIPKSYKEQMMLAMAVSLAEARSKNGPP